MDRARLRFFAVLALFVAWAIGLGVMAYTSAEKPRNDEPAPTTPRPG
jgi:hypothetical protein